MKLIISGGGTGGHVYPAIAIAHEFLSRSEKNEVLFMGAKQGLECKLIPMENFKIITYDLAYVKGVKFASQLVALNKLFAAVWEARKDILKFDSDILLGVGGYASSAGVIAAILSSTSLYLAEQNVRPGITNRWLAKFAKKVFVTDAASIKYFPHGKAIVTGNPIRREFYEQNQEIPPKEDNKFNLVVLGGSQGSATLNSALAGAVKNLNKYADKLYITHQTGEAGYKEVENSYKDAKFEHKVLPFVYDIVDTLKRADLVISRSGAGSIAEISSLGKPAIYVPYPYAADDHQLSNAKEIEKESAAIVVLDKDFDSTIVMLQIEKLINDQPLLAQMSRNCIRLAKTDAAKVIVDELLAGKKSKDSNVI
ncbi:MAG: undecaprenyldiphospho-muramoylpentapeptide beta-N-acetylglucosaminyltransferase [Nitrospinota bacterium]